MTNLKNYASIHPNPLLLLALIHGLETAISLTIQSQPQIRSRETADVCDARTLIEEPNLYLYDLKERLPTKLNTCGQEHYVICQCVQDLPILLAPRMLRENTENRKYRDTKNLPRIPKTGDTGDEVRSSLPLLILVISQPKYSKSCLI